MNDRQFDRVVRWAVDGLALAAGGVLVPLVLIIILVVGNPVWITGDLWLFILIPFLAVGVVGSSGGLAVGALNRWMVRVRAGDVGSAGEDSRGVEARDPRHEEDALRPGVVTPRLASRASGVHAPADQTSWARFGPAIVVSLGWYVVCAGLGYYAFLYPEGVASSKWPATMVEELARVQAKFDRAKWVCGSGVVMMAVGAVMGIARRTRA